MKGKADIETTSTVSHQRLFTRFQANNSMQRQKGKIYNKSIQPILIKTIRVCVITDQNNSHTVTKLVSIGKAMSEYEEAPAKFYGKTLYLRKAALQELAVLLIDWQATFFIKPV